MTATAERMLARRPTLLFLVNEASMLRYQCCFCAENIERPECEGVHLSVVAMRSDPTAQDLFAHIACLDARFAPILASDTAFDASAFEPA